MKKRVLLGTLLVACIVLFAAPFVIAASDDVLVLRLGHVVDDKSGIQVGAEKMAEILAEKSGGKIKLEVYPHSQLGGNREMLESLQAGVLEMQAPAVAFLGGFNELTKILDLPYMFKNNAAAEFVLDGEVGTEILAALEDAGFVGLGWWTQGWRHLTTSKRPVRKPEDMKGLKIRVMENALHIEHFKALGASPIPMAYSEVLTSLQQGVIDGQENPYQNIKQAGFFEVQQYIIETGHIYDPIPVLFSKALWDNLTADQQKMIRDAAREATRFQRDYTYNLEADIRNEILGAGKNTVIQLTPEERAEFLKAVQPVYDNHSAEFGEYVKRIMKAQEAF